MYKNKLSLLILSTAIFSSPLSHGYNIGYDGADALVSYETSWGKERFVKEDYLKYFPYYQKYVESFDWVNVAGLNMSTLPQPYSELKDVLPFNPFGMYFNSVFTAKLFKHNSFKSALEIGSYFGVSTRHIASLLPENSSLYAVDSWAYYPGMYEQFLSNVVRSGLTNKIIPVKQASQDAIETFKMMRSKFDFIYVDGDHETDGVVRDLELYFPLLSDHGVICGDDWLLTTVRDAVLIFAQKYNLTICAGCNFWFLKREGAFQIKSVIDADDATWMF